MLGYSFVGITIIEFLFLMLNSKLSGFIKIICMAANLLFILIVITSFVLVAMSATKSKSRGWTTIGEVGMNVVKFLTVLIGALSTSLILSSCMA